MFKYKNQKSCLRLEMNFSFPKKRWINLESHRKSFWTHRKKKEIKRKWPFIILIQIFMIYDIWKKKLIFCWHHLRNDFIVLSLIFLHIFICQWTQRGVKLKSRSLAPIMIDWSTNYLPILFNIIIILTTSWYVNVVMKAKKH